MRTRFLPPAVLAVFAASAFAAEPSLTLVATPERDAVDPGREAILQIEIAAKPSPKKKKTAPLNLAIVLDRSGSMRGAKIEKARQAACAAVDRLGNDDVFSLVVYDDTVQVRIPPDRVGDKEALKREIETIQPGGSTALHAGVETGARQLREFLGEERVSRVILLSDGLANTGPSSPGELASLGSALRDDGISVSTVGLGDDYNEDLMTALAEASHANYYYVADVETLPKIFEEEMGAAQSVVARKVRVVVRLGEGVEAIEVLGDKELKFEGGTLTIPVEDLSGAQKRRFLVSCRLPRNASGSVDLGSATVEYEDAIADAHRSATADAVVRVARDTAESDASLRAEVAQNVAITRNRLAKEEAVRLADAGRADQAAELLHSQIATNAALPSAARSAALDRENRVLDAAARSLRANAGFSKAERKSIEYQNYQDRKQKR